MSDSPTSPPTYPAPPQPWQTQQAPDQQTPGQQAPPQQAPAEEPSSQPSLSSAIDRLTSRTTAATALASIGALLLVIAAGTFIAVSWEHLGLLAKASIVSAIAAAAIGAGFSLRNRLPGTASVFTHLGAALVPLDVGGIAVSFGADRPTTGIIAGLAGVVGFVALDRKLHHYGATLRSGDARLTDIGAVGGRAMAVGRVLSASALLLGFSATVGLRPAVMFLAIAAMLAALRAAWESIGLALVAGGGPLARWAGERSLDGSFFHELADIAAASAVETTIVAAGALVVIAGAAIRHKEGWLGFAAGAIVAVSAAPDAASVFVDHQQATLIFVSAALLAGRALAWFRRAHHVGSLLDIAVMLTSVAGLTIGLAAADDGMLAPDLGIGIAAALLAAGWLVSDAAANVSEPLIRRLWTGASGPVSGVGLAVAALLGAVATGSALWGAVLLLAVATGVGLAPRMMAPTVAASTTIAAVFASLVDPGFHVQIGLAAAVILLGRSLLTHNERKVQPPDTAIEQWLGVGLAILTLLVTPMFGPQGLAPAGLALGVAVAMAAVVHRWVGVPQFEWPTRLLMIAATVPAFDTLSQAGIALTVVGALLSLEGLLRNNKPILVFGAPTMTLGSWLWASGQDLMAAEWFLAAPTFLVFVYGFLASRSGASSWGGMPVGVTLFAGAALLERIDSAILHDNMATAEIMNGGDFGATSGWHAVVAGVVSIIALTLGVERKWQGPTAAGLVFLTATVIIEAGAVVPLVPVWVLLGIGGSLLLGAGLALERGAQRSARVAVAHGPSPEGTQPAESGPLATLKATWAEFQ